ncbi:MAG TPA: cupin domain-containing protein, partial [Longimicrobiaceae bacterium]|nr:cupin domain-containing protein [Longimicrobiaceae bacterium]
CNISDADSTTEAFMSSLNRPLSGPLLIFNLREQLAEMRQEEGFSRGGRAGRTLTKAGRMRLVLVAMVEGNVIHTNQAESPLTIHVLEGEITFRADDSDHQMHEGEILFFGPGDAHDITAIRPSSLLITISAIGDDYDSDLF